MDWNETEKRIRATLSGMGLERDIDDVVQEVLLELVSGSQEGIEQLIRNAKRSQYRDHWMERYYVREFGKNPVSESSEIESSYFDFVCAGSGAVNRHAYDDSNRDIGDEKLQEKLNIEFTEFIGWLRAKEETKQWVIETLLQRKKGL